MTVKLLLGDWLRTLDEGGDHLAQSLVGQADDGDLTHRRVKRQTALDLDGRDVLAAADDHVVDAAGDEEIAILIDVSGVASEIPAVAERARICVGPPPVALEGLVAGQQRNDLAFL